jgi:uncharacterized protein (DUF302 family)
MQRESNAATYRVPQPFEAVVRSLRRALAEAGMKVTGELNVAERIRQILSIGMSPCVILFASAIDQTATWPSPLQIVVADRGQESEIHILRVLLAA